MGKFVWLTQRLLLYLLPLALFSEESEPRLPQIRSVLLLGPDKKTENFPVEGIGTNGIVFSNNFPHLAEELKLYLSELLTQRRIEEMRKKIAAYYIEDGFSEALVDAEGDTQGNTSFTIFPYGKREGLKGLVITSRKEDFFDEQILKGLCGIDMHSIIIPGAPKELNKQLSELLGRPINYELTREIKSTIHAFYEAHHDPFTLVLIPEQKISHQVLQVVVVKTRLGDLRVEGNQYFSSAVLERYIKMEPEEELDILEIQRDLDVINRNPFRRVNAVYARGQKFGTTDLILATTDRRPWRVYSGVDDTGLISTGRERFLTGITVGRFLGYDQLISYQYTAAYTLKHFQAHTGQWMIFLPWNHLLNFYGGYSVVEADLPLPSFKNKGENSSISARYTVPTRSRPLSSQEISIGFDYKRTNNTILFSELIQNFGPPVNLSQFMAEYRRNWETGSFHNELDLQCFWSPGELLSQETDARYGGLRSSATNKWVYGKGSFRCLHKFSNDFSLSVWLRGQYTSNLLLPTEQLGIGGYDTVRGYEERQLSMDEGFIGNLEARTPPYPIFSRLKKNPTHRDAFQILLFADYGFGHNKNLYVGEPQTAYLLSAGPGFRYTYDPYLTVRADYGFRLHHLDAIPDRSGLVHFSVIASF